MVHILVEDGRERLIKDGTYYLYCTVCKTPTGRWVKVYPHESYGFCSNCDMGTVQRTEEE